MDQITRQIITREPTSLRNRALQLDNVNVSINEVKEIDSIIDTAKPIFLRNILTLRKKLSRIDGSIVHTIATVDAFEGAYKMYLQNSTQRLNPVLLYLNMVQDLSLI